jgi:adenylate cyclase, class 2
MSYEVEMKFRSADHDRLRRLLLECGAREEPAVEQEDVYLRHPFRDFARTHEALRLRRIGPDNRVTYKGPRHPGPTKTREEIEISFGEGDEAFRDLARLFEILGFQAVGTIRKRRTSFHVARPPLEIEVTLDHVEGLGDFAEIEAIAGAEADLPAGQAAVMSLADQLGLGQVEQRSYLRMWLEARENG